MTVRHAGPDRLSDPVTALTCDNTTGSREQGKTSPNQLAPLSTPTYCYHYI